MTDVAASSPISRRRDLELLSQQRRKAELRLAQERARNARLAVAGVAGVTLLLGIGLQSGLVSLGGRPMPSEPMQFEERGGEFAATHVGHVLLPTGDDQTCRELAFYNDTGRFGQGHTVRCTTAVSATIDQVAADANGRAQAVRAWFASQ